MQSNAVDQRVVGKNIALYLRQKNRDEDFIWGTKNGYCAGITSLWLYSKWLQTQANPEKKPRDDAVWFQATVEAIARWDGRKETAPPEFERFISLIESFQKTGEYLYETQGNLEKVIKDTKRRELKSEYTIASLLTLDQLKQLLWKKGLVQEGRLIYIDSPNHATGLFMQEGKYYFFDPNTGAVEKTSLDEVAKLIFDANFYTVQEHPFKIMPPDYNKPSPLGFRMFSFEENPKIPYPQQREVLAEIRPALDRIRGRAFECSGLDMAVQLDSLESMEYFLEKGVDPSSASTSNWPPLMLAATWGATKVLDRLLGIEVVIKKINQWDENHYTALVLAARYNRTAAAAILLEKGANLNVATLDGFTALIFAAKNGNIELVKMLLSKGANLNASDINGKNALMYAVKNKHFEIARLLLQQPNIEPITGIYAMAHPIKAIGMARAIRKIKKTTKEKAGEIEPQLPQQEPSSTKKIREKLEQQPITVIAEASTSQMPSSSSSQTQTVSSKSSQPMKPSEATSSTQFVSSKN